MKNKVSGSGLAGKAYDLMVLRLLVHFTMSQIVSTRFTAEEDQTLNQIMKGFKTGSQLYLHLYLANKCHLEVGDLLLTIVFLLS